MARQDSYTTFTCQHPGCPKVAAVRCRRGIEGQAIYLCQTHREAFLSMTNGQAHWYASQTDALIKDRSTGMNASMMNPTPDPYVFRNMTSNLTRRNGKRER